MDWSNERYVRIYLRQTTAWKLLGWEGQAAFCLLEMQLDRTGALEIQDLSPANAIALTTGLPPDVAAVAAERLLRLKFFEHVDGYLIDPTFIEAQEASKSSIARQQEHRMKRRDEIRRGLDASQRETAIYFVQSEHGGEIKIGRADDVAKRLVGLQTGRADKLVLLAATQGSVAQEKALHARFAAHRAKGEWFHQCDDLVALTKAVSANGSAALTEWLASQPVTTNTLEPPNEAVTGHSVPCRAVPSVPCLPEKELNLVAADASYAREDFGGGRVIRVARVTDTSLPAARGAAWLSEALSQEPFPHSGKWAGALAELIAKPEPEREIAARTLAAEAARLENPKAVLNPIHVRDYWHLYSAGKAPGKRGDSVQLGAAEVEAARRENERCELEWERAPSPEAKAIAQQKWLEAGKKLKAAKERFGWTG